MQSIKYLLVVVVTVVVLAEMLLRFMGYRPGILMPPKQITDLALNFTDSLYLTTLFAPDSNGIMMINPDYNPANFDREFEHFNATLKKMVKRNVFNVPINSHGYQDTEFSTKDTTGKSKIMLLGDSFTWGYSADSIQNSFANLLGAEPGYVTYNLGVPGSDVATYLKLTELYVPALKPHYLIVNFYVSNDFLPYRKVLKPFTYPDVYPTNAGGFYVMNYETIENDSIELFETYQDAYQYTARKFTWRGESNPLLRASIKHSALLTQTVLAVKGYYAPQVKSIHVPAIDCTSEYLLQIDRICRAHNTRFVLAVINNGSPDNIEDVKKCRASFGNLPFYTPTNIKKPKDFVPSPDGHFNTAGHWKYEQFLLKILNGTQPQL